ncbi:putative gustatory receptor 59d [Lucilia sericata]|uniref:putative gustatory receptor 59d n=1 Tax=Lucilia sericata TaxID=13632 RepID=UPI0018A8670B|nr:putative gustatory receptor 59d [Lucilia sericata]
MKRSTYWMLSTVYIYAQLLGILNFCYDCRTGRAHIKPHITVYSAVISITMFGVLTYFFLHMEIKSHPPGSAELHYKLNFLTSIIRVVGVILTVFYNWTRRRESVQLINSYRKFCKKFLQKWQMEERYMQYLEHGIRIKLKRSFIADVLVYVIINQHLGVIFDMENRYILLALALIPTVLNVVMTLYYFAILNINIFMTIINEEIKRILNTANTICKSGVRNPLDNFSLQLAQFPLEFDLIGLFNMNRPMAFAILSSTISNAIVLMQYDLKYTKSN